jgi:hypothetical protein
MIKTQEKKNLVDKKTRMQNLVEYHQKTFKALGVDDPLFVPTMAYKPYTKTELHVSLFPSQLKKGQDIYTEFVNKEFEPETEERTLYKWKYNKYWEEEYDSVELENSSDRRYLIPVSELTAVAVLTDVPDESTIISFDTFDEIMDPDEDCPVDRITLRDLAAIMLNKPVSRKKWLNQIIKS